MKKCFAIGLLKPSPKQTRMALACARSLRAVGHTEDIVIITYDPEFKVDWLDVRCFSPLEHPSLDLTTTSYRLTCWCDLGKLYFWALDDYDKVIALDPDIMFFDKVEVDYWDMPSLTGINAGKFGPLCSCFMVLEPTGSGEMINTLMDSSFSYEEGWNKEGKINWKFQASNAGQGFLYYYFKFVKNSFHYFDLWTGKWFHYGGELKDSPKYQKEINGLIPYQ